MLVSKFKKSNLQMAVVQSKNLKPLLPNWLREQEKRAERPKASRATKREIEVKKKWKKIVFDVLYLHSLVLGWLLNGKFFGDWSMKLRFLSFTYFFFCPISLNLWKFVQIDLIYCQIFSLWFFLCNKFKFVKIEFELLFLIIIFLMQ